MLQTKFNQKKSSEMDALMGEVDAQMASMRTSFIPGEKMRGTVIAAGGAFVVLDLNSKVQGVIEKTAFTDIPIPEIGDQIEAYFVEIQDGSAKLVLYSGISATNGAADEAIQQAYASKLPIEGKIEKAVNGGFEVNIAGARAFCPFSQIRVPGPRPADGAERDHTALLGKTYPFLIIECKDRECVVSNRALVEQEKAEKRAALRAELKIGDVRDGVVVKLMPFGAFVDIGGVEGLIPLRELSWDRNANPADIVQEGQLARVEVLAMDWENDKFLLSLRSATTDPFVEYAQQFAAGDLVTGKVVKLMQFGAFVQLEPGVEGLVPIAKLGSGRRINHPREVVSEGDALDLKIESIDPATKKISLSVIDRRVLELVPGEIMIGAIVKGIIESIQPFGIFVRLSEEKTGLLHISETQTEKGGNPLAKLEAKFPISSKLEVLVKGMEGDRISLALPNSAANAAAAASAEENEEADLARLIKSNNNSTGSISSIGSLLDDMFK